MLAHLSQRWVLISAASLCACAARPTPGAPCPAPSPADTATPAPPAGAAPSVETTAPALVPAEPPPTTTATARAPSPRDTAAFNAWLETSGDARDLPLLVARAFAGTEARNVGISVSYASGEAAVGATATVTLDGLLDDSVRGEEHVLTFARDSVETPWRLLRASSRVRCRQGRGHTELSTTPCT